MVNQKIKGEKPVIAYQLRINDPEVKPETITKQSNIGSTPSKYKVNDKVDILYNSNNIEEFIIKGDKSSNVIGIIFIVLGGIVFVCGIIRKF